MVMANVNHNILFGTSEADKDKFVYELIQIE